MNIEFRMSNIESNEVIRLQNQKRTSAFSVLCCVFCLLFSVLLLAGCNHGSDRTMLLNQIEQLSKQKSDLEYKINQTESENEQLKNQIHVLSGLPDDVTLSKLNQLQTVKIGKLTNLYDTDENGKYENLIVYIQPIDEYGDRVKVTGSVDVQLWDLNKSEDQALIGQWHADPDMLKKHWVELLVINYRLTFDLPEEIDPNVSGQEPLTVKVKFTDYMSGRVFNEQKVIKPQNP